MVTNRDIEPEPVEVSGERSTIAAARAALDEHTARHERRRLLELFGTLDWDRDNDYLAERDRRQP